MVTSRTSSFGRLAFVLVVVATTASASRAGAQSAEANDALARERYQAAVVAFDAGS